MAFTARHYNEVARIIQNGRAYADAYPTEGNFAEDRRANSEYVRGYQHALNRVAVDLRRTFAADNPRFDRTRFDMACEPKEGQ